MNRLEEITINQYLSECAGHSKGHLEQVDGQNTKSCGVGHYLLYPKKVGNDQNRKKMQLVTGKNDLHLQENIPIYTQIKSSNHYYQMTFACETVTLALCSFGCGKVACGGFVCQEILVGDM
ncbi:hypothetical protein GOODEAATRI_011937 [Goodea atripinnis]|uniref:Uncharacterized protein n=1 Tax=Goodea atripinnis TaxID=208336 RepID=A0ABV0PMU0_9TELE